MEEELLQQITRLENIINESLESTEIESAFVKHCQSSFLAKLNTTHLDSISKDNHYMAPMTSGKLNM